ncbi:MAG: ECF transporter S component, partial [Oscillospiraceae bacterium]
MKNSVKTVAKIGVLGALATLLMLIEIPLWFAPSFYKIDLSEIPVLLGGFALGPIAGVFIELIKIVLNFFINGTITGGIGELSNFLIGCALVVPASIIYRKNKSKKGAIIGLAIGILCLTVFGS